MFDTATMLSVHRNGKRHIKGKSNYILYRMRNGCGFLHLVFARCKIIMFYSSRDVVL